MSIARAQKRDSPELKRLRMRNTRSSAATRRDVKGFSWWIVTVKRVPVTPIHLHSVSQQEPNVLENG